MIRVAMVAVLLLAGCAGGGDGSLMNLRATSGGPDEFAILPPGPLEIPDDLAALPEPAPGGTNRTDPTPRADAVAALGGNRARLAGEAPAADSAILAHVTRHGVAPGIRTRLAAEDREFRQRNRGRLLERLFNVSVYFRAYERQSLNQYAELERWRRQGVRTVGAPPE